MLMHSGLPYLYLYQNRKNWCLVWLVCKVILKRSRWGMVGLQVPAYSQFLSDGGADAEYERVQG